MRTHLKNFASLPILRREGARAVLGAAILVGALFALAGCGGAGSTAAGSGKLNVVVAEDFWGSIAEQVGGDRVAVTDIITNPAADPHDYEPTAEDGRALASAQVSIVNGIGYDEWAGRLLSASHLSGRIVLNVGKLLSLPAGANPHQWYSPAHVAAVIDGITAAYQRLDPADAGYFSELRSRVLGAGLARYDELRSEIRSQFAGVPVGYSESIFQPLGEDLRLRLLTPSSFAKAIAEGSDVTAASKQTVDEQASRRLIKVWVFNSQNVTPDVQRVNALVKQQHIPLATVTETLTPPSDSFEQWQVAQLEGLLAALRASGAR
jgi:zinc/manganese transport system substrate-binding protein